MLRAIREIQPRWVVGENVFGLVNWSGGLVFHEVQADLEAEGYEVQPFVLPAVSVNAPHRRDRVFFVAYSKSARTGNDIGGVRGVSNGCNKRKEDELFVAKNTHINGCVFGESIEKGAEVRQQRDIGAGDTERVRGEEMAGVTAYAKGNGSTSSKLGESESRQQIQTGGNVDGFEGLGDATDTISNGRQKHSGSMECESRTEKGGGHKFTIRLNDNGTDGDAADTNGIGLRGKSDGVGNAGFFSQNDKASYWQTFPTVSPIRMRDDGVSNKLLRFVVKEFYDTISYTSQENRIKNLQEVWESIQSEEIWEQIRGFYSLESKNVLFQTVQLYSSEWHQQGELSPFSKELCQPILQHLSKYKEFRCSPQGQELEKQRFIQFGNTLSFLPHEVALAARRFEAAIAKFESWHRNESIKAGGNAVVPQVVFQIFKTIAEYEKLTIQRPSV